MYDDVTYIQVQAWVKFVDAQSNKLILTLIESSAGVCVYIYRERGGGGEEESICSLMTACLREEGILTQGQTRRKRNRDGERERERERERELY